jgi:hypothetical protein
MCFGWCFAGTTALDGCGVSTLTFVIDLILVWPFGTWEVGMTVLMTSGRDAGIGPMIGNRPSLITQEASLLAVEFSLFCEIHSLFD